MINLVSVYQHNYAEKHLYELLRERAPDINISHREMPTFEQHVAFVRSMPYRQWFMIEDASSALGNYVVGHVILTNNNEIGVGVFKGCQRKGYAREAIRTMMEWYRPLPGVPSVRPGHFIANINPANEASIKLFTGLGARHIQNTYQFD